MKKNDLMPAVIWLGLGIFVAISAYRMGVGRFAKPGPGLMPFLLGIILSLCSLPILIRSSLILMRDEEHQFESMWSGINFKKLIIVLVLLMSFWFFLEKAGFPVMTFLFLLILFKTTGSQKWYSALFSTVLITILVYLLFVVVLKVELPSGLLKVI